MTFRYGKQLYCIFSACGNLFLTGLALGWASPALPKLMDADQTPFDHLLTQTEVAILTTMILSSIIILPFTEPICRRFGRKPLILSIATVRAITWLATARVSTPPALYLVKCIDAQSAGLGYIVTVMYVSEIASVEIRGFALTCLGIFINLGIFAVYSFGPFVSYAQLAAGCSALVFVFALFITESPAYLLRTSRHQEAKKQLKSLRKISCDSDPHEVCIAILNSEDEREEHYWYRCKQLFCVRRNLKAFALISVTAVALECCGVLPVLMHMTTIFHQAGTSVPPHIASIIVAAIQLLPSLTSGLLVDRLGRRLLLLLSCGVTTLSNFTMGMTFYLEHVRSPVVEHIKWLPLVSVINFVIFYSIGLGVIPGTLCGELLDVRVKSLGSSLVMLQITLTSMAVVSSFGLLRAALGLHAVFWLYAAAGASAFGVLYRCLPETRGKTFAQIQEMLA